MATWPSYATIASIAEKPQSAMLRTKMESGPPKETKVRSKQTILRPITVHLASLTDYQNFTAWIRVTLDRGKDWFDWTDPVDGQTKQAKIVNGLYEGDPAGNTLQTWHVQITLETLE